MKPRLIETDELERRMTDLRTLIRHHITDDDFDTLELLDMTRLLHDYDRALNDLLLYDNIELTEDLLMISTDAHLNNAKGE